MDDTTQTVRSFYARFPYPGTGWQVRADSFPSLLLSYVDREPWPRTLQLLDAGCGTGAALVPIAAMHPECRVVGADLSEPSLAVAKAAAEAQGVSLELHPADLSDEADQAKLLKGSPGGFDVIWLSGVLHHCPEPGAMLRGLRRLLAHDGVASIMVYAKFGRQPVDRLARAIRLAKPEGSLDEREAWARAVLRDLEPGPVLKAPFDDALRASPAEFADRYLHPHARSYSVDALMAELADAGLRPLRWLEPRAWSPEALLGPGPAADSLKAMPEPQRWRIIEQLFDHLALELLVCHTDRADRAPPSRHYLGDEVVDWNPQASMRSVTRRLGGAAWEDSVEGRLRAGPFEPLSPTQALIARAIEGAERIDALCERLVGQLAGVEDAKSVLEDAIHDMLTAEWLYRPNG